MEWHDARRDSPLFLPGLLVTAPAGPWGRRALPCAKVLAWLVLGCIGCGPGSKAPLRFDVSGRVTYDGMPVPSGTIYFEADGSRGNKGPVSIVGIENGHYDTKARRAAGPVKGPLVVRINGISQVGQDGDPRPPLFPEYTTTVDLVPGGGTHVFDFDVPLNPRPGGSSDRPK